MESNGAVVGKWGSESFFFTEAARGGPLAWRVGGEKLDGDALGPVRHAHDDAAEYYFMFSGDAIVECGGREFVLKEGELGYIPPDVPHNFLGPAGERDACLFCVIGPNFAENKWRVRDFKAEALNLEMEVATPFADQTLPGDRLLGAEGIELAAGEAPRSLDPAGFEVVYLVVSGAMELSLENGLQGAVEAGRYIHLREGIAHQVSASAPARILRLDCRFEAWKDVPTAADVGAA